MSSFDSTDRRIARCTDRMPDYPQQLITLSRLAYHIQKRTQDQINAALKKYGLTTVSHTVLMVLYGSEDETQRASELGEACSEKPANMTRICNELAEKGWIQRRNSEEDRRSVIISLSRSGRALIEKVSPEYWAVLERSYAGMSATALKEQERVLRRQLANLEEGS
ncbi:MAG TPA: MarR family transcriptional regulator [Rhodocyclaceae bacterium]|jgi:MarR family transcriptional repressor of emrRAB|nr:MarR family transcriptional regulator [Rhodocyclaceae bacterium]